MSKKSDIFIFFTPIFKIQLNHLLQFSETVAILGQLCNSELSSENTSFITDLDMPEKLTIATRQSPLALWQANTVKEQLEQHHPNLSVELLPLTTQGDQMLDRSLAQVGGKGLFLKELEYALLDGRAHIAVHSMKDVPAQLPDGCVMHTILPRGNPFDVLVSNKYTHPSALPKHAVIGTTSLRRQSQLLAQHPSLNVRSLRGNINTRLAKLETGAYDAIILAGAGIERLNIATPHVFTFTSDVMLPACGQGIIGIEARCDDDKTHAYLAPLHHPETATVLAAERAVSEKLNGGCSAPIGAFATLNNTEQVHIQGRVCTPDGHIVLTENIEGCAADARILGMQLAERLLNQGASKILAALKS